MLNAAFAASSVGKNMPIKYTSIDITCEGL
jgi:hypothetical protein